MHARDENAHTHVFDVYAHGTHAVMKLLQRYLCDQKEHL
jgi:hypothetical protein